MDRSIKLFDIRTHKLIQHYGEAHGASSQPSSIEGYSGLSGGVNSVGFGGMHTCGLTNLLMKKVETGNI